MLGRRTRDDGGAVCEGDEGIEMGIFRLIVQAFFDMAEEGHGGLKALQAGVSMVSKEGEHGGKLVSGQIVSSLGRADLRSQLMSLL